MTSNSASNSSQILLGERMGWSENVEDMTNSSQAVSCVYVNACFQLVGSLPGVDCCVIESVAVSYGYAFCL